MGENHRTPKPTLVRRSEISGDWSSPDIAGIEEHNADDPLFLEQRDTVFDVELQKGITTNFIAFVIDCGNISKIVPPHRVNSPR